MAEIEFFYISDTSTLAKLLERPVNVNASQRINSKNIADKSKSGYSELIEKTLQEMMIYCPRYNFFHKVGWRYKIN